MDGLYTGSEPLRADARRDELEQAARQADERAVAAPFDTIALRVQSIDGTLQRIAPLPFSNLQGAALADGGGDLQLLIGARLSAEAYYLLERIAISPRDTALATFALYVIPDTENPSAVPNDLFLADYSPDLSMAAIADETKAIYVPGGAQIVGVWAGVAAGARCTVNIQYRYGRNAPGLTTPAGVNR